MEMAKMGGGDQMDAQNIDRQLEYPRKFNIMAMFGIRTR